MLSAKNESHLNGRDKTALIGVIGDICDICDICGSLLLPKPERPLPNVSPLPPFALPERCHVRDVVFPVPRVERERLVERHHPLVLGMHEAAGEVGGL
jgi:hypothetical protein